MWGELCEELGELCGGTVRGELCVGSCVWGAVWGCCVGAVYGEAVWWDCVGELCVGTLAGELGELCEACTPVTRWSRYAHTIASSTVSPKGIPHYPLSNCPTSCPYSSVPTHSSSQVVHCRVYPPHPLHEYCCYGNHFNSSCTLMFVGALILQWWSPILLNIHIWNGYI